MTEEQRPRVLQMTQKTNQFNLCTKRLTAIPEGVDCYVTLVSDKYGDYGLVGVSFVREAEAELVVENMMMSCRVLGRGVEARMLSHLGHLAQGRPVVIEFQPTPRNEPAKKFLEEHGLLPAGGQGGAQAFPAEQVAATKLNTDVEVASAPVGKSEAAVSKGKAAPPATSASPAAYHAVALACEVMAAAAAPQQKKQWEQSEVEARILEIVADLARASGLSISVEATTPLMEAGVTSLLAIALAGKLSRELDLRLSPVVVFEHPTPRALAAHILGRVSSASPSAAAVMAPSVELRPTTTITMEAAVGRFPGGVGGRTDMTRLLSACGDAVNEVPAARWVLRR